MATRHSSQHVRLPHSIGRARIAPSPKTSQEDEAQLIRQVAQQNHGAFEVLYRLYTPRLMSFLMRYLGCTTLCEEVLHEVLLIVWEHAASFRTTTPVSTWIFGIARHKALQVRTSEAKRRRTTTPILPAWRTEDFPEIHVLHQTLAKAMEKAMLKLPPRSADSAHASVLPRLYLSGDCSANRVFGFYRTEPGAASPASLGHSPGRSANGGN